MKQSSKNLRPLILLIAGFGLIIIAGLFFLTQSASSVKTPITTPMLMRDDEVYPEVTRISAGDAKAAFDLKSAVFVDTRDAASFNQGHIPGAINVPSNEIESNLGKLNKADWIITYCT